MRNEATFRKFTAFASACAAAMLSPASAAPGKASATEIVIIEKSRKEYGDIPGNAGAAKSENAA
ncbi:MAG: hypothetical protein NC093_01460 [Alistipes sp.]|nr:hypothetical protein [Alistipes sp.]